MAWLFDRFFTGCDTTITSFTFHFVGVHARTWVVPLGADLDPELFADEVELAMAHYGELGYFVTLFDIRYMRDYYRLGRHIWTRVLLRRYHPDTFELLAILPVTP